MCKYSLFIYILGLQVLLPLISSLKKNRNQNFVSVSAPKKHLGRKIPQIPRTSVARTPNTVETCSNLSKIIPNSLGNRSNDPKNMRNSMGLRSNSAKSTPNSVTTRSNVRKNIQNSVEARLKPAKIIPNSMRGKTNASKKIMNPIAARPSASNTTPNFVTTKSHVPTSKPTSTIQTNKPQTNSTTVYKNLTNPEPSGMSSSKPSTSTNKNFLPISAPKFCVNTSTNITSTDTMKPFFNIEIFPRPQSEIDKPVILHKSHKTTEF